MSAAWIPVLLLVLLAAAARRLSGSLLAPGAFFASYWAVMTAAPLALAPQFPVSPVATWWIFTSCFCLYLGSVAGEYIGRAAPRRAAVWKPRQMHVLRLAVIVTSVLGFGVILAHLAAGGFSLSVFKSIDALASAGRQFSLARYNESYSGPLLARLLLIPLYLSAPLGGWLTASAATRRMRLLGMLPLVPAFGVMAVLTTKASLIFALALWSGGYFAFVTWQGKRLSDVVSAGTVLKLAAGGVGLMVAFALSFMARYALRDTTAFAFVIGRMRAYAFGHLTAFSWWVDQGGLRQGEPTLGAQTFAGLYDLLGFTNREQGIFVEFVFLDAKNKTNIFTFFRGLAADFTAQGSLLLLVAVGFVFGASYTLVKRGYLRCLGVLSTFYAFTLWSFVVSILNYNSIFTAVLLLCGASLVSTIALFRRRVHAPHLEAYAAA